MNVFVICDEEDVNRIKKLDVIIRYDKVFFFTEEIYNPVDYQKWCDQSDIDIDFKFDLVVNFLSPEKIKNYNLLYFILSNQSKGILIFLDRNSFYSLKKILIDCDLKNRSVAIQRFKSTVSLESISEELKIFKNFVFLSEEIVLECDDMKNFLKNKDNRWFFTEEHFKNLDSAFDLEGSFDIEMIFNIVIFKKVQ